MRAASWAVSARGLGKRYRLGEAVGRPRSLYELLTDGFARLSGASTDRRRADEVWALEDVDFEIAPGEVVGVVGRNGAGKSTLLKVLSRITTPTTGRVELRGRLASLLEVGTGFHPELTGRENIYLNGTILGMRRREIDRKFDEIVAFAETERFLDTPVKRYSSGMYVRLAFAVAAHLDADVLVVDEVLSVGDAAFQRKSLGRMADISTSGRTVIFVSHNLGAVRRLCGSVLVLERGRLRFRGSTEEGVGLYEDQIAAQPALEAPQFHGALSDRIRFRSLRFLQEGREVERVDPEAELTIEVEGVAEERFEALDLNIGVSRDGVRLFSCHDAAAATPMDPGPFRSSFRLAAATLRPGRYAVGLGAYRPGMVETLWSPEVAILEVTERWGERVEEREVGAVGVEYRGERRQ
jgi:lipopolysaccharide transport system ATP-binding protein